MITKNEIADRLRAALDEYEKTGARDLPSVRKSVPRVFRDAVDDLVASVAETLATVEGAR